MRIPKMLFLRASRKTKSSCLSVNNMASEAPRDEKGLKVRDKQTFSTPIPTRWVGPLILKGDVVDGEVSVPLATFESPLWPSTDRGAGVSRHSGGIHVTMVDERMTRSIAVRAPSGAEAVAAWRRIEAQFDKVAEIIATTSRFARLNRLNRQIAGNLLFVRVECITGDASGHNMVTKAAEAVLEWILADQPHLTYSSISGNLCTDKKPSAVNGLLGRGKYMIAEIEIPRKILTRMLRTDAEKMVLLNHEKNYVGGTLAGSLRSANAHFANMLLAFYLATGQDAANIIEGSQGQVTCEKRGEDLYFACTLPNLIMGSVGAGKGNTAVEDNLARMGCKDDRPAGENARRLAGICAATVLCGELSLLAAQTNPGELVRTHMELER
ncbi:3-hydroxy-3-methylglutaryl-coenzyme A reductase [Shimia marina]|uniref:3-hydroxy-3-methylglutaryl-coenzyme A reductase n=1 Tax=Shimia marina TaxID=321267 RepID=A0A0P1ELU8_9RHOB|nr:3-hydroxy-3-methylglutaryl-coenzyme A reductase [Shimia marina]SFD51699.1 3-hydroxy-3-methylglutaryl-coenzyme A reductase [Shimia marina]